jgi:hypothetical protein
MKTILSITVVLALLWSTAQSSIVDCKNFINQFDLKARTFTPTAEQLALRTAAEEKLQAMDQEGCVADIKKAISLFKVSK